jgi:hypothetical protein
VQERSSYRGRAGAQVSKDFRNSKRVAYVLFTTFSKLPGVVVGGRHIGPFNHPQIALWVIDSHYSNELLQISAVSS